MAKGKKIRKKKSKHGEGFKRTKKQWENSAAAHIGRFLDRMTTSDLLNLIAFGTGAYATYYGITKAAEVSEMIPDWLRFIAPLSPFLYQFTIPVDVAQKLTEMDKIVLALIGGYSTVKLAPIIVRAAVEAAPSAVVGA